MKFVVLLIIAVFFAGCGDIQDLKRRREILTQMARTNATEPQVLLALPGEWVTYAKDSPKGRAFGDSLITKNSKDLASARAAWTNCDRALYHTSQSVVTLVFIKTNTVIQFYVGVQ